MNREWTYSRPDARKGVAFKSPKSHKSLVFLSGSLLLMWRTKAADIPAFAPFKLLCVHPWIIPDRLAVNTLARRYFDWRQKPEFSSSSRASLSSPERSVSTAMTELLSRASCAPRCRSLHT
jgi:hypothetical protein